MMQVLHFEIHVKPEVVEEFATFSYENAAASQHESGMIRYEVFQDASTLTRFIFLEVYRTEADVKAHLDTPHFAKWQASTEGMIVGNSRGGAFKQIFPTNAGE